MRSIQKRNKNIKTLYLKVIILCNMIIHTSFCHSHHYPKPSFPHYQVQSSQLQYLPSAVSVKLMKLQKGGKLFILNSLYVTDSKNSPTFTPTSYPCYFIFSNVKVLLSALVSQTQCLYTYWQTWPYRQHHSFHAFLSPILLSNPWSFALLHVPWVEQYQYPSLSAVNQIWLNDIILVKRS